jgi:1-acyl-sn-glycerol-3-phosphate acyltransferase
MVTLVTTASDPHARKRTNNVVHKRNGIECSRLKIASKDSDWPDTLSYISAFIIFLNFSSAAAWLMVMKVVFYRLCPSIWFAARILGYRFAFLLPTLAMKCANIRFRTTGQTGAILALGAMPPSNFTFSTWFQRYIDLLTPGKLPRALVISNHLSWADPMVLSSWLLAYNSFGGDGCCPFWKGLFKFPLGWMLYMCDNPMMGFGKVKDIQTIRKAVSNFFERHMTRFVLYPEGSVFFREKVQEKSREYARVNNLPNLNNCLLPKVGAFYCAGKDLYQQGMRTLLDLTIAYPCDSSLYNKPYNVMDLFKFHREPVHILVHARAFPMKHVPWDDEEKVQAWLVQRFVEKDAILKEYYEEKRGPLMGGLEEGPRWLDLLLDLIVWIGLQYILYACLYSVGAKVTKELVLRGPPVHS